MTTRNGCAFILFVIIIFCVIVVNTPPLTQQERDAYRAYQARKRIEEQLEIMAASGHKSLGQRIRELENSPRGRQLKAEAEAEVAAEQARAVPSLPPSILNR